MLRMGFQISAGLIDRYKTSPMSEFCDTGDDEHYCAGCGDRICNGTEHYVVNGDEYYCSVCDWRVKEMADDVLTELFGRHAEDDILNAIVDSMTREEL